MSTRQCYLNRLNTPILFRRKSTTPSRINHPLEYNSSAFRLWPICHCRLSGWIMVGKNIYWVINFRQNRVQMSQVFAIADFTRSIKVDILKNDQSTSFHNKNKNIYCSVFKIKAKEPENYWLRKKMSKFHSFWPKSGLKLFCAKNINHAI